MDQEGKLDLFSFKEYYPGPGICSNSLLLLSLLEVKLFPLSVEIVENLNNWTKRYAVIGNAKRSDLSKPNNFPAPDAYDVT